jgi:hypothetical protein
LIEVRQPTTVIPASLETENYLPLDGPLPRPPPEGFPVVLGRFATGGAFEPPDLSAGADPLLPSLDFDIAISLVL